MRNRSGLFLGVALIVWGLLVLLGRGHLFWPIALILVGLWIVFNGRLFNKQVDKALAVDLQSASSAHLRIDFGAGELRIGSSAAAGRVIEGIVNEEAIVTSSLSGDVMTVHLRNQSNFLNTNGFRWDLHLARSVVYEFEIHTGASSSRVDLSDAQVSRLELNTGASETALIFPASGRTQATVHAGAAEVRLTIPSGVAARIRSQSGLAEVRVDRSRFPYKDGMYQSADFESAANRVDLDISVGFSSLRVM